MSKEKIYEYKDNAYIYTKCKHNYTFYIYTRIILPFCSKYNSVLLKILLKILFTDMVKYLKSFEDPISSIDIYEYIYIVSKTEDYCQLLLSK